MSSRSMGAMWHLSCHCETVNGKDPGEKEKLLTLWPVNNHKFANVLSCITDIIFSA